MRILNALALSVFLLLSLVPAHAQEGPPVPTPMNTLRPAHPRLFIHDSDLPSIKVRIAKDDFAKRQYQWLYDRAQSLLSIPPEAFDLRGPRPTLLPVAREVAGRIFTLAGIYRLTGDRRFADRAIAEMLSAAKFPDWHPRTPLNTAELTAGMGVGYDWLYPVMTPDQRTEIRQAIIEKGIDTYFARINKNQMHYTNNWAQVIYGGHTIAALAIAEPGDSASIERAQKVVGYARPGIDLVMRLFAPDGGFEEGPVYWNYATNFNVLYLNALDTALGTDFGESNATGFNLTPRYEIQATGPTTFYANFSDAHVDPQSSPQMFWFANRFHHPEYAVYERSLKPAMAAKHEQLTDFFHTPRFYMMELFWYASAPLPKTAPTLPLVESFSRISQAFMRTSWTDPNAWYVALKGGKAVVSHSHLDLGSFVLDAFGQRWASDLGPETYGVPEYFGKLRWTYYRAQTRAHNTIAVDDANEDRSADATILYAGSHGKDKLSLIDLDSAYKKKLQSWKRGIAILDNHRVLIQDEITPIASVDLVWHLHTFAKVQIAPDKRSATLDQNGVHMQLRILSPLKAGFSIAAPPVLKPGETPNPGVTDLVIDQQQVSGNQVIAVLFAKPGDKTHVRLHKLADWQKK